MAMKRRAVPDPSISVVDLQSCLQAFCQEQGSYDLHGLLVHQGAKKHSWKTAPDPEWMAQLAPLFKKLVLKARNLVLSGKKLKAAMMKTQILGNYIYIGFCLDMLL